MHAEIESRVLDALELHLKNRTSKYFNFLWAAAEGWTCIKHFKKLIRSDDDKMWSNLPLSVTGKQITSLEG